MDTTFIEDTKEVQSINFSYLNKILRKKIKQALAKYAGIDTRQLDIEVSDNAIVLNGTVTLPHQKEDADLIINLLTKGSALLINNLRIEPEYLDAEAFI